MAGKKTGKRLLTWVLVLVMALSLLPLNALAEDYSAENPVPEETTLKKGDTYTLDTDDASLLPEAPEGLRWDGPESIKGGQIICGKNEHQHDSDCYQWEWFLIFYRKLVCNQEEHIHSDYCYNHTYKWTLVKEGDITTSNTWRRWWPVYWTLSKSGRIDANDAIESVTAGKNVAYTNSPLDSAEALARTTATLGDAVDAGGFTITTKPGYYVKAARVICGNYNKCGVSNNLVPTGQTEGNYSNTIDIRFDQGNNDLNFDHLSANGNDVNLPKDYPTSRPTGNDYHNVLWVGSTKNTLYPYYFLIQVAQDPTTYSVSYDWGDQELSNSVPKGETNLKRNESYEVSKPSKEALAEAAEKNLAFAGWKYNNSNMTYQVGESFSVSEDVRLTAQWTQLYTVSYELDGGSWKDGEAVENANYPENVSVSVTNNEPEKSGYEFIDRTPSTDNNNVDTPVISKGKFTMPAANVVLTAQWKLIEAPELSVKKTVTKVGETTVAAGNNTIPTAYPGDEIEWTITVTNSGNAAGDFTLKEALSNITVKDAAGNPVALSNNGWSGTVAANDSVNYTVTYTVKASDVTDNGLVNTVTMNGTSEESAPVPTAQKYTVTGTIDNGGTVTESPQTVNHNGRSKAMTFTPANGYEIASVKVKTGNDMETVTGFDKQSYTYAAQENVTADITVTVETTKRSDLSYTVNYYWNGTTQTVANSTTVNDQTFDTEVTVSPAQIEGYTPVSSAEKTIKIDADNSKNVINFYYYKNVTLTAKSDTVTYNGKEQTIEGYTCDTPNVTFEGITASGKGTNAGEYTVKFSDGAVSKTDTTGKYIVANTVNGKLTINKRSVTLTSANASKPYDGTALTNKNVTIGGDGFADGEGATYNVTGTITNVGTVDNAFTYTLKDGTKATNYIITKTEGKLTITEASAPTPATFDFNDVISGDGKNTPAITKTVKGNVGRNFKETFKVTVEPKSDNAKNNTMTPDYYTGKAEVIASKSLKDVPFLFKPEAMANAVVPYGKLRFTEAGTYTYTVWEVPGMTSRMSYDTTEYTLTITVALDKEANAYKVTSWQFTAGNGKYPANTPLNIVNTYRAYHPSTPSKPTLNTGDHYAYVMGYPDGTVRPNGSITRAEVSTILFRLLSDKTRDEYFTTESSFTDVKAGAWYNNSIATLEKAGVIVDTAKGGAFRPNEAITRAELAAMLAQFSDAKPVKGVKFSDVSAEHWAYEAIAIAAKMGWIEGYPDGTFRPDATITRAEMMTLVNRTLERVPSDEDHLLSKRVMLTFPDCKSGDWFYIAVQEATNSHTYERAATEKNGDEQWTALRANRDWTLLEK